MSVGNELEQLAAARYARLQATMVRHRVGCVLLATPHLATAASGARRVQVGGSGGTMPWVVVARGAPAATVFTTDPDGVPAWMPRTHVRPLCWDRARQMEEIAALVGETRGAIACDVSSPTIAPLLAGRPVVDAVPLLAEAFANRSPSEVSATMRALTAARHAVRAAREVARGAARPLDLLVACVRTMSARRAGFPVGEMLCWRAVAGLARLAPDAALVADDVLALEWGAYVAGYAGVAGDTFAVDGAPLTELRRRWDLALGLVAKQCRAGSSAAALCAAAHDAGATQAGFLASGLGIGLEPPYVDLEVTAAEPIRAGSVLVLAPVVTLDGKSFRATRALLVTDDAHRWLEEAP